MPLRTLNYGNYGIFLVMGNAGFISSTVVIQTTMFQRPQCYRQWRLQVDVVGHGIVAVVVIVAVPAVVVDSV